MPGPGMSQGTEPLDHVRLQTSPEESSPQALVISVRVLMVLIVLLAAGLGWKVKRARAQKRAVFRIEEVHGEIRYEYPFSVEGSSWVPAWLKKLEVTSQNYYDATTDRLVEPKDGDLPDRITFQFSLNGPIKMDVPGKPPEVAALQLERLTHLRTLHESPWTPGWLQRRIGAEYFREVTSVSLNDTKTTK